MGSNKNKLLISQSINASNTLSKFVMERNSPSYRKIVLNDPMVVSPYNSKSIFLPLVENEITLTNFVNESDTKRPVSNSRLTNKIRTLKLNNGKTLTTPIIWFGLSVIESVEFQREVFERAGVNAFLSNVYDLRFQDKKSKRDDLIKIFRNNGMLHKMDSGGFQLMKNNMKKKGKKIDLTPEMVFETQLNTGCDIAVQLDIPLSPNLTKKKQYETIERTVENFVKLKDLNDDNGKPLTIMPVAHGYDVDTLEYGIKKYEEILGRIDLIGIGSLVPMVKTMQGTNKIGGKRKFVELLMYIRKRLPESIIHAFGIGGTMSYLAFYCGIDSLDSNGWIQKSAYGVIQLPGISDRFLTKKEHNRAYLIENRVYKKNGKTFIINEVERFLDCQCPVCKPLSERFKDRKRLWEEKVKVFEQEGAQGRLVRSIHNVWTFNRELERIKNNIKNGTLEYFIEQRLQTSIYYGLFEYARKLIYLDAEQLREKLNEHIRSKKIRNKTLI